MTSNAQVPEGLLPVPTRIRSIGREIGKGSTAPYHCTLRGVLKFDHPQEAPNCVYNEMVAMRLGVAVGAPVAMGTLVAAERGEGFVSLVIGAVNFSLPELDEPLWEPAVAAFPNHAASLVAFDIFIGNYDRRYNIKADTRRKNLGFFAGFDHSHCLLDVNFDVSLSLRNLGAGSLVVTEHPFYKAAALDKHRVLHYAERISRLSEETIANACIFGDAFRRVSLDQQEALAGALCDRRLLLSKIIRDNSIVIFGK